MDLPLGCAVWKNYGVFPLGQGLRFGESGNFGLKLKLTRVLQILLVSSFLWSHSGSEPVADVESSIYSRSVGQNCKTSQTRSPKCVLVSPIPTFFVGWTLDSDRGWGGFLLHPSRAEFLQLWQSIWGQQVFIDGFVTNRTGIKHLKYFQSSFTLSEIWTTLLVVIWTTNHLFFSPQAFCKRCKLLVGFCKKISLKITWAIRSFVWGFSIIFWSASFKR